MGISTCDCIPNGIKKIIDEYNNNRGKSRRYKLALDLYSDICYLHPFENGSKRIAKLLAIYAFNNNNN